MRLDEGVAGALERGKAEKQRLLQLMWHYFPYPERLVILNGLGGLNTAVVGLSRDYILLYK
jgi:hypothetical protein